MKNAKLYLLILLGVFTVTANAQNYYQEKNLNELQPVFDTLPNGTIINLFDGTIIESISNSKQIKSGAIKKRSVAGLSAKKLTQLHEPRKTQIKSVQLIKSLNQEVSPYYMEKLDSVVGFEPIMIPGYDSIRVAGEKRMVKFDGNGYVTEVITDTLDKVTNTYREKEKIEYTPDAEGKLLQQINYYWDGSSWENATQRINEYDANGKIILAESKNWNGNNWENASKTEYAYNEDGNRTLYAVYTVDENKEWMELYEYIDTFYENGEHATNNYFCWLGYNRRHMDF